MIDRKRYRVRKKTKRESLRVHETVCRVNGFNLRRPKSVFIQAELGYRLTPEKMLSIALDPSELFGSCGQLGAFQGLQVLFFFLFKSVWAKQMACSPIQDHMREGNHAVREFSGAGLSL